MTQGNLLEGDHGGAIERDAEEGPDAEHEDHRNSQQREIGASEFYRERLNAPCNVSQAESNRISDRDRDGRAGPE